MAIQRASGELYRYEAVERHILSLIESGELTPGDRIPSLRNIGSRFGVSVSTVNQAYMALEGQGVIEARPKSGFFVRSACNRPPAPAPEAKRECAPRAVTRSGLIRQVLNEMASEDILPLGVARTSPDLLPVKALGRIMSRVVSDSGRKAAGYGDVIGDVGLRRQIAFRMADLGIDVSPDRMIVTAGAMEALFIALRSVTRPGDNVIIASPSYYCFLQLLENIGLRALELPSRPDGGIDPDELERVVARYNVAACILAPNFNNPDGALIPDESKEKIAGILARRSVPLIEDDVYGDVYFGRKRPLTCKSFDKKGLVLYCSSFSKTLCPGYRVGWMLPGAFSEMAFEIKATTSVSSCSPVQMAVAEYLRAGLYDRHLRGLRAAMARQARTMEERIRRYFPEGVRMTRPEGGAVLWVELPGGVDASRFYYEARAKDIGVAPGNIFSTCDKFSECVRISYGSPWSPELEEGVRVLGEIAGRLMS